MHEGSYQRFTPSAIAAQARTAPPHADRCAAEHMNEITLTLLRSMILMTQAVIDAANRAAASESVAAAVIGRLADRNAALSAENASLTVQLAAAVAAGNDDAAEAAVAGVLTVATDGLDAAVVAAEPPPVVVAPVADAVAA